MSRRAKRGVATPAPTQEPEPNSDNDSDDDSRPAANEKSPLRQGARGTPKGSPPAASAPRRGRRRRFGDDEDEEAALAPSATQASEESGVSEGEGGSGHRRRGSPEKDSPRGKKRGGLLGLFGGRGGRSDSSGDDEAADNDTERADESDADGGSARSKDKKKGKNAKGKGAEGKADNDDDDDGAAGEGGAPSPAASKAPPSIGLTERGNPISDNPRKQAELEKEVYMQPRADPFSMLSRRFAGTALYVQPISDLKDGLHVEPMPHLDARSAYLLDVRLGDDFKPPTKAERVDGSVKRQPDPVRHVRVRPSHPGMGAEIETARPSRATLHLVDAASSHRAGGQHTLQVSVGLVQLHDHPLFRTEHALQRRLRSLAAEFGEMRERDTYGIHRRRVVELRRRLEPYLTAQGANEAASAAGGNDVVRALCVEMLQARRERDEHECAERLLARRMLHLWHQLRLERRQQGYTATRAKLQVQLVREEDHTERDLDEEVDERRLLHSLEHAARAAQHAPARDGEEPPDAEVFEEAIVREDVASRQQTLRRAAEEQLLVPVYTEVRGPCH